MVDFSLYILLLERLGGKMLDLHCEHYNVQTSLKKAR